MTDCPHCLHEMSAAVIPQSNIINCHNCNKKYNLVELVQQIEREEWGAKSEKEVLQYLKELTEILRELEKQGYEIQCEDNHSFNCTKKIKKSTIQKEYEKVSSILNL